VNRKPILIFVASFIVIFVASFIVLALVGLMYGFTRKELHSTESPAKRYSVKLIQKRFLIERAVYLNASRASEPFVRGKLLYTGDFMDNEFGDLYQITHGCRNLS
jgi:hypothetical protein